VVSLSVIMESNSQCHICTVFGMIRLSTMHAYFIVVIVITVSTVINRMQSHFWHCAATYHYWQQPISTVSTGALKVAYGKGCQ